MTPNLSDLVNQQYYLKYGACYESIIIVKYLLNFKQVGICNSDMQHIRAL